MRGNGTAGALHISVGTYQVDFTSDQTGCAYEATAGDAAAGAVSGPVEMTVASRAGDANGLFIQAYDQTTGALIDVPFHVQTYCGAAPNYAVIGSTGTIARGAHVVSAAQISTGNYEVIFDHNVSKCAFTATIGTTSSGSIVAGTITVAGRSGNKNGVFIHTMDRAGVALDTSFHVAVDCTAKKLIGVVNADGTTARGAHVTSSVKLSGANGGTYQVIFDRNVATCSYTATIGTTTNGGSVSSPVVITTASRAGNVNGVFLFIHSSNGATIDEPFHLSVFC